MVKASALYIVIIIALAIAVLCSSLILAAYFYKTEYQKKFRYDQLEDNVNSGINILMAGEDTTYAKEKTFSLFGGDADSVALKRTFWGIYEIGIVEAFIQKDTLYRTFSIANGIDSSKWAAIYLMDEERPFSLSGKTTIRGDAFIPSAGVKEAYIDNKAYTGDKRLVIGTKHPSEKQLPALDKKKMQQFEQYLAQDHPEDSSLLKKDSVQQSFLRSTRFASFKKNITTLRNIHLSGNIALFSDTTLVIDSTAVLNNILVFARSIHVKKGFHGQVQLFATDSISVDSSCRFDYPSCLGVLRFQVPKPATQAKITLGAKTEFIGLIFTYGKTDAVPKPFIVIGKKARVTGQVYSQGVLELKDTTEIDGSVFASRFLYRGTSTLYENYLINTTIDSKALSPYYLTSEMVPVAKKKKESIAMAGKKLNRKVRASSILEVVISMVIIVLVFGIAMMIYTNVSRMSLSVKKIKAQALLRKTLIRAEQIPYQANQSLTIGDFRIEQEIKPFEADTSLNEIHLTAYDANQQKIAEVKKIIFKHE